MSLIDNLRDRLSHDLNELGSSLRNITEKIIGGVDQILTPKQPALGLEAAAPDGTGDRFIDLAQAFATKRDGTSSRKNSAEERLLRTMGDLLNGKVSRVLDEEGATKRIYAAIRKEGVTLELVNRMATALNDLSVGVIRAIDSQDAWQALAAVLARLDKKEHTYFQRGGPQIRNGAELTLAMLEGVHKSEQDRGKEQKVLEIMRHYDGLPDLLLAFLEKVGYAYGGQPAKSHLVYNPFEAVRIAVRDFPAVRDLPKELIMELSSSHQALRDISVRGDSGIVITSGEVYRAYGPKSPQVQWVATEHAFLKPFEAFGGSEFSKEGRKVILRQRGETAEAVLKDTAFGVSDEETSEEKEAVSLLEVRNFKGLEAIKQSIDAYRAVAHHMLFGGHLMTYATVDSLVATSPGGTWMGEIGRRYKELTEEQKLAYDSLRDPVVKLSRSEALYLTRFLLIEEARQKIDKKAALGALLSDVNEYKAFHASSPEKLQGILLAESKVADILHSESSLIDFQALALVADRFHFVRKFRGERNLQYLDEHRVEVERAIERFSPFFRDPGPTGNKLWKRDALGAGLGIRRLQKSLYGKKIGHRHGEKVNEPVLDMQDWSAIKNLLFADTVLGGIKNPAFVTSLCINAFKKLIDEGARYPLAKTDLLEKRLKEGGKVVTDRMDVGHELDHWSPYILAGRSLVFAVDFFKGETISLSEFRTRVESRFAKRMRDRLSAELDAGLIAVDEDFKKFYQKVLALVPASELKAELDFGKSLVAHPFVQGDVRIFPFSRTESLEGAYFYPEEAEALRKLFELKPILEERGFLDSKKIRELDAALKKFEKASFHCVLPAATLTSQPKEFRIRTVQGLEPFSYYSTHGAIKIIQPDKLTELVDMITNGYKAWDHLSEAFFDNLKFLASDKAAMQALKIMQLGVISSDAGTALSTMPRGAPCYLSNELIEKVETLSSDLREFIKSGGIERANATIGPNKLLQWVDGEPTINFGTQHRDQSLIEVTAKDNDYVRFLASKLVIKGMDPKQYEHVKSIAAKALQFLQAKYVPGRNGAIKMWVFERPFEFKEWLRTNYPPDRA